MTNSQLSSQLTSAANLQKAWHLLSLVHANGRPIRLTELASSLFTLDLIRSLCSIPDSPVFLIPNRFLSITRSAFVVFTQFLWFLRSGLAFVPRTLRFIGPNASLQNVTNVYTRKRKRNVAWIQILPGLDTTVFREKYPPIVFNISNEIQTVFATNQVHLKSLRAFEWFTVEEEEGTGPCGNSSELSSAANLQKAWHLMSLVHANGRPIRLTELASRFTLYLIKSLCSIPDSPVFLIPNRFLSITRSAFVAFTQFLRYLRSGLAFVPRTLRYIGPNTSSLQNVTKVYSRKRKRNVAGIQIFPGPDTAAFREKYPPIVFNISTENQTVCAKKLKQNHVRKEHRKSSSQFLKNQVQLKSLPDFECFTVEEEEGSGGYGTVYRAKRKCDGVILALKCPRGNANRHHIRNEQKMLEKFGGKNFIIKYEGSFKHGTADCLVLQHVEHERPGVLSKEIDLFQLQWYGYCLFRSLASLHKQGVIHRDVKPGNFLFSRTATKGFLIDFNLAMDMYKKYGTTDKSAVSSGTDLKHVPLPSGSGIASAKDGPCNKVLSDERLKEPLPCKGRKELISMAQKAVYGPNYEIASPPSSKRKRIATPTEKVDSDIIYLTPMPLHSSGVAIPGAGFIKSRGKETNKKEGPCVGTKGFRAPEVLLKSPFQGPKIDVWSAGVTLVYQSTVRSPFDGGDSDRYLIFSGSNIMDIAKLRGSEDLWEVAKLHSRESSFPVQLLDVQYFPSKKLRDWFVLNTKRPELLRDLSRSFFDLVDKCLTVNPRLRISAEDALKHEFFAPCHEQLKQQRQRRRGLSSDLQGLQC